MALKTTPEMVALAASLSGLPPGMYPDATEREHRADPATAKSDIDAWVRGKKASGRALTIGSAVHGVVLEPESAAARYVVADEDFPLNTRDGKALMAALEAEHPGRTVLRPAEWEEVRGVVRALRASEAATRVLEADGHNEVTMVAEIHPGILSKARVDMVRNNSLWDLKTTSAKDADEFEAHILKYRYDVQASYYAEIHAALDGWKPFGWVCVSKVTHECWVYPAQPYHYWSGRRWWTDMLNLMGRQNNAD